MSMVFQMTIKFLADSANVLQPLIEPDFVLCFLWYGNHDTTDCSWRHNAANRHYLAVTAVQDVVYDRTKLGLRLSGCFVVETHNDLTTVVFRHCMEDATSYVGAHPVDNRHRHICSSGNHLCLLEQSLALSMTVVRCLLPVIVCHMKSHQTVWDERIADENGKLGHHVDIIFLAICDETLAVIGAAIVLESGITKGKSLRTPVCGEAANEATEQNQHDCSAQDLVVHKPHTWCRAYCHNGESTCGMCVGESEHEPHTVPALAHRPGHQG